MLYSEKLAKFLYQTSFDALPPKVISTAKNHLLDTLGCGIKGSYEPSVQRALNGFMLMPNFNKAESKIWGHDKTSQYLEASMINAMSSHALDFDDTYTQGILHQSCILTPLILTYGLSLNLSAKQLLRAYILGLEVGTRVGEIANGCFHERGFHSTAIIGCFGAVATASLLLDLNQDQIVNAFGLVGSLASGLNEFLTNGSDSKILHVANALQNGLQAAYLAKGGMKGPISIFEGKDGLFASFGLTDRLNLEALDYDLGEHYNCLKISLKPYPCCHFAHAFIEIIHNLRKEGLKASDIKEIKVLIHKTPASFICENITAKQRPKSAYEAKFALPFLMALMLEDGFISVDSFKQLDRAEILSTSQKISYEIYDFPTFPKYFSAALELRFTNDKLIKKELLVNTGNPDKPLSKQGIEEKFVLNLKNGANEKLTFDLIERINNFENLNSSELEVFKKI